MQVQAPRGMDDGFYAGYRSPEPFIDTDRVLSTTVTPSDVNTPGGHNADINVFKYGDVSNPADFARNNSYVSLSKLGEIDVPADAQTANFGDISNFVKLAVFGVGAWLVFKWYKTRKGT